MWFSIGKCVCARRQQLVYLCCWIPDSFPLFLFLENSWKNVGTFVPKTFYGLELEYGAHSKQLCFFLLRKHYQKESKCFTATTFQFCFQANQFNSHLIPFKKQMGFFSDRLAKVVVLLPKHPNKNVAEAFLRLRALF